MSTATEKRPGYEVQTQYDFIKNLQDALSADMETLTIQMPMPLVERLITKAKMFNRSPNELVQTFFRLGFVVLDATDNPHNRLILEEESNEDPNVVRRTILMKPCELMKKD